MHNKQWMGAAAWVVGALAGGGVAAPALAADVGVSISVSQPGVYGRVDIGQFPQPQVVMAQPVFVAPPPRMVVRPEPVYMWVPPGHQKKWSRYCGQYHACGVPVYFVQDRWYHEHVRRDRGEWRGEDRHDRDDDRRGPGNDRGRGHGRGHDH